MAKSKRQTRIQTTVEPKRETKFEAGSEPLPELIQVTLLLAGGQDVTLAIEPNDPLIQQFYEVLLDWEGKRTRRLFQIPLEDGHSMLAFPCDRLMGLVTDPALVVEPSEADSSAAVCVSPSVSTFDSSPNKLPNLLPNTTLSDLSRFDPLTSRYLQLENFLSSTEHQLLLEYVFDRQAEFVSTLTSTGAENYRKSVVLYTFPEFAALIHQRIQAILPEVLAHLGLPAFPIGQIEAQLTAHNDGNFYKIHNDNGSPDTATRELTYVYYFHQEPKAFSGGELVIYDSQKQAQYYVAGETHHIIEPLNNSIVFFLSRYMHEVLPVRCPSQQFADSRFTINGWVRRAD
jgi:Rps23 Pro-64 3,4-dihydroxylase Tpa1-like proline 4-hydroxylase